MIDVPLSTPSTIYLFYRVFYPTIIPLRLQTSPSFHRNYADKHIVLLV